MIDSHRASAALIFRAGSTRTPHFHARYGNDVISVTISDGRVIGVFPKRALRMVLEWHDLHADELMENWRRLRDRQAPHRIAPLE